MNKPRRPELMGATRLSELILAAKKTGRCPILERACYKPGLEGGDGM